MITVVIPYIREWPQVVFTIRSVAEALKEIDFEIIAVDNLQKKAEADRGTANVSGMANKHGWLRYFHENGRLSHWQCKNLAMREAKGDIFLFVDAHCIAPYNDLAGACKYYEKNWEELNGSLHMPLTYHILEAKQLIYKAVFDLPRSDYAYTFHTLDHKEFLGKRVLEVPTMSTCGMMIHKTFMERIGFWPTELGIYGGGEHFLNYTMAVMGFKKYIYRTDSCLYHHGDKRGYSWNHHDYQRNRAIATYMFGGEKILLEWLNKSAKLRPREKDFMFADLLKKCIDQREKIRNAQTMTVEEFAASWKGSSLSKGDWG
jgi:glycosyltransferase involved in cell wall biosynthesis